MVVFKERWLGEKPDNVHLCNALFALRIQGSDPVDSGNELKVFRIRKVQTDTGSAVIDVKAEGADFIPVSHDLLVLVGEIGRPQNDLLSIADFEVAISEIGFLRAVYSGQELSLADTKTIT